jgi:hypothetical protein
MHEKKMCRDHDEQKRPGHPLKGEGCGQAAGNHAAGQSPGYGQGDHQRGQPKRQRRHGLLARFHEDRQNQRVKSRDNKDVFQKNIIVSKGEAFKKD